MRDLQSGGPTRRLLACVGILVLWAGFVAWKRFALQDGVIDHERFASSVGVFTVNAIVLIAVQIHAVWKARQPKPPPVYRSTILD